MRIEKKWVVIASIIAVVVAVFGWFYPSNLNWLNGTVLTITLVVLIWYTFETKKIADITYETNLRPVILRSGWIEKWDDVKPIVSTEESNVEPRLLQFTIQLTVLKNIAKDINGYVILNNKKYRLLFGNDISSKKHKPDSKLTEIHCLPYWGWMKPDSLLYAVFRESEYDEIVCENCIYISYKDIEGNEYFTKENKNFSQTSGKI